MAFKLTHSQNFLHNPNLVKYLLGKTTITNHDIVVEIGPGKGIITETLASICHLVQAVEKDTALAQQLKNKLRNQKRIEIVADDFLSYPLPDKQYKIFSNIPFTITADIVKRILNCPNPPQDSYLIMQQEAAAKFSGQPYGPETMISILNKPVFSFEIIHTFKQSDFKPVPKVTSVLLRINKRTNPFVQLKDLELYKDFVVYGFTQNPGLQRAFEKIFNNNEFNQLANEFNFSTDAKPTDIAFDQWLGIFEYFLHTASQDKRSKIKGAYKRISLMQQNLTKVHRTRLR